MHDKNKMTMPAMPAAIKKIHRPTLIMKTYTEVREEKTREQRERGRYSIIVPRSQEA